MYYNYYFCIINSFYKVLQVLFEFYKMFDENFYIVMQLEKRVGDMGIYGGMVYILSFLWSNYGIVYSLFSLVYVGLGDIGKIY